MLLYYTAQQILIIFIIYSHTRNVFDEKYYINIYLNDTWGGLASTLHAICAVSRLATPYTLTPLGVQTGETGKQKQILRNTDMNEVK